MELTLSDGRTISLSPGTARALLGAAPLPDAPDVWSPVYRGAPGNTALIEQGLAERTRQGFLSLTLLGHEARSRLLDPHAAGGPRRITLDPDLSDREKRAVLVASADRNTADRSEPAGRNKTILRMSYGALLTYVACQILLDLSPVGTIPLVLFAAVAVAVPSELSARERARRDPRRVLRDLADRYVTLDMVEGEYRSLLERAQRAVDTVLESGPHREGLLLDTVRNEVVLAETEWIIAHGLVRLGREAVRADRTPVTGERSRAAAERARAALAGERGRLEHRIGLLEEYAARVRAFEDERTDASSARAFDAVADRVVESGAAHEHHEAELRSLVRAQEAALRLSEPTDPDAVGA
ncbi:hypothetical protein PWG71_06910 [Nocardiopsis sp. N85]|uniref:hypothetical protein n=1 Tax=Nocardiopsis sp. N85 TaxID=3029400 RepID=UPI00237F9DA7|nr:hypothetical protein [Nocardiopsis sp. N85]MDE3721113.1 hypothetical protein [Nocardiopsis sp. N85]